MLLNASAMKGYAIIAEDGEIGTVSDFFFDYANWRVRWLVADTDTGSIFSARKVLLPPAAITQTDADDRRIAVKLSMRQVRDSPKIESDQPPSSRTENGLHEYYGTYLAESGIAEGGRLGGPQPELAVAGHWPRDKDIAAVPPDDGDPHLFSITDASGYRVHASDGDIGHVEDYLLEEADWSIRFLVVDTKTLWSERKVLVSQRMVQQIDGAEKLITLHIDRERVKNSPAYDPRVPVDTTFEAYYQSYYGGPQSDDPT